VDKCDTQTAEHSNVIKKMFITMCATCPISSNWSNISSFSLRNNVSSSKWMCGFIIVHLFSSCRLHTDSHFSIPLRHRIYQLFHSADTELPCCKTVVSWFALFWTVPCSRNTRMHIEIFRTLYNNILTENAHM